jgi:hypothetical protein
MSKMNLEEATLKALYDELDDSKQVNDVNGIIDGVLVVTDPEVNTEQYDEIVERAQEIIEDTPEGNIPLDDEFLGQYAQTCPLCGATFVTDDILEPGATCPICLEVPEAFVMKGKLEAEDQVAKDNGIIDNDEEDHNNLITPGTQEYADDVNNVEVEDDTSELEKDVASLQMNQGNKLEESKLEEIECLDESIDEETDYIQRCLNAAKEKFGRDLTSEEIDLIKNIAPIMRPKNESVEEHNLSKDLFGDEAVNRNIQRAKDFEKHLQYVKDIMAGKTVVDDKYNEEIDLQTAKKWLRDDYVYIKGLLSFSPEEIDKKLAQDLPEIFGNNLNESTKIKEEAKLIETGEWDDTDEDMASWLEDMKNLVEYIANRINGKVESVQGFDKYQGPYAIVDTPKHGQVEFWFDPEDGNGTTLIANMSNLDKGYLKGDANYFIEILNNDNIDEKEIITENLLAESYTTSNHFNKVEESISENEVIQLHNDIENAEDMDEIQSLIYSISDGVLEDEVQRAYDQCVIDGDSLDFVKDFIISTLEDNAEYEEDELDESKKIEEDITESDENKASLEDVQDLENAGDAVNKLWDACIGGESDFLNTYRDDLAEICDSLDNILQKAKESRNGLEEEKSLEEAFTFDTTSYIGAHGKDPKGFGRWGFSIGTSKVEDYDADTVVFTPAMSYTDAKKFAKQTFKDRGMSNGIIYVLS